MKLQSLKNTRGSKNRKRVGRGDSSGLGRTCGRGEKGQKSRSGSTIRPHFEGGQMPLFRRLPHIRGFKARNHKNWTCVNISSIEAAFEAGATVEGSVTPQGSQGAAARSGKKTSKAKTKVSQDNSAELPFSEKVAS